MKHIFSVPDEVVDYFKLNYVAGDKDSVQKILEHLRSLGHSQMQSIFLLITEAGFTISDAAAAVDMVWK